MTLKIRIIVLLGCLLALGCGPKKGIVTKKKHKKDHTEVTEKSAESDVRSSGSVTNKPPSSTEVYIERFSRIAMSQMRTSGIPASITLAQGILESGSGRGRLAVEANNHFGIKCHGWKGEKIYHDDDRSQECFRKYKRVESSYQDHSDFLTKRKRYANLFKLRANDYKGWARGLKAAGYATDRRYPEKLISLIERYKLYSYDQQVLDHSMPERVEVNRGVIRYVIEQGDTLYALSKRFNTTVEAIKELNNMSSNELTIGQELMIPSKE